MPPEKNGEITPLDWLARAKGNLARVREPKPADAFWEDYCFDVQQAVEKSLKALILDRKLPFKYTHNIADLLKILEDNGVILPEGVCAATYLTDYAVEVRYPGPFEAVTEEEFEEALQVAEIVIVWVSGQLAK
ncbi:MAG: HEPN domain-containing protein [bacterium]|nr:HEPN domain-containing protein [bacterium]